MGGSKEEKENELREAARAGDLAKVKKLLNDDVNVNAANKQVKAARPHSAHTAIRAL